MTVTREQPEGWPGYSGRRGSRELLADAPAWPAAERPLVALPGGPTGFVEATSKLLVALGHEPSPLRTERFGATGR